MSTPAGWYPDHHGTLRYWDGTRWTAHTAPAPLPPTSPDPIVLRESPPVGPAPYGSGVAPYGSARYGSSVAPYGSAQAGAMVPQYGAAPPVALPNGVGVAGFVVGLVSMFLPLIFGLIGGVTGLILSIVALALPQRRRGLAIAGLVLSILAIILIL